MRQYIIRRVLLIIPTLLGVTILVSLLVEILPGDFVDTLLEDYTGQGESIQEFRARVEEQLGLGKPWHEAYATWLWNAVQGDFGTSLQGSFRTVWAELGARIPVTMELGILSLFVGTLVAVPVGVYAAVRQDTAGDYVLRSLAVLALALPGFWLAVLIISIVFPRLGLPPLPVEYATPTEDLVENLRKMYVPAILLGTALAGPVMRLTRGEMLEVLRQDYVRTARAKGLRENVVVVRHALRNAMIPLLTILGLQAGLLIGGSVIMESIFNLPGMGLKMIDALKRRDIPVIMGIMVVIALFVIIVNLVVDLLYAVVDPRIRYS